MREELKILEGILEEFKLGSNSKLYRYTSRDYLQEMNGELYLNAKTYSTDTVIDHYEDKGHFYTSGEIGKGLSFLRQAEKDYIREDRVLVSVRLGDVLDQGGLIYRITSLSSYLEGYFCTLPKECVKVIKE
jgi:hypothetical protein